MAYIVYRREQNGDLTKVLTADNREQADKFLQRMKKFAPADYEIKEPVDRAPVDRVQNTTVSPNANTIVQLQREAREIAGVFHKAAHAQTRLIRSLSVDFPNACTPLGVRALLYLLQHRAQDITTTDLGHGVSSSLSWVSRTIEELVKIGMVTRVPHETDQRSTYLKLTENGMSLVGRVQADLERAFSTALIDLSPPERLVVQRFLQKTTIELRKHLPAQ